MRVFASQSQSPFLVFSQSCVSSHENRQGLRGEDLGGLRGGGWTRRGGREWNGVGCGGGGFGMAPKKLTRQLGLGRPLWQRSYWEESHKTLGPYLKFMMCAFWSAIDYVQILFFKLTSHNFLFSFAVSKPLSTEDKSHLQAALALWGKWCHLSW